MFDNVTITYRGARYEIGRGRDFYGIWAVGAARSQPLERWPETPEGWSAAWTRFTEIEAPGTIAPAGQRTTVSIGASTGGVIAAGLLAAGVVLGVVGLFPSYFAGQSLATWTVELVPHVIYLAAWTVSAVLILLGGVRLRVGALLGLGMSIVTFGLYFADAGTVISGGAHLLGAGLLLSLVSWLAAAAGSVLAFRLGPAGQAASPAVARRPGRLARPSGSELGPVGLLVLAGLGTAIAFAPSWDSFTLRTATATQTIAEGNAFSNPGPVIAGDVAVMVAVVLVVIAAALWRPVRHGAALLAGATIPMAAQAVSALVQVSEPTPPAQFGISSGQAAQLGLTITNGLTPSFWIYCVCVVVLFVSCAWMLFTPQQAPIPSAATADAGPPVADAGIWHTADDMGDLQSPVTGRPDDGDDEYSGDEDEDSSAVTPGWQTAPTPPGPVTRDDDGPVG